MPDIAFLVDLLEREFFGLPLDFHARTRSSRYVDDATGTR
jgi:hypothetical protein